MLGFDDFEDVAGFLMILKTMLAFDDFEFSAGF